MTRKSPIRHRVKQHTRQGRIVNSFVRGKGSRTQKVVNSSPKKLVTKIKEKKFLGKIGGMKVYLANTVKMIYVPLSYQKKLEASHEEVNMDKITRKWNPPKWWIEEEKRTKEKGMPPAHLHLMSNGRYKVDDGVHRIHAAKKHGYDSVPILIKYGVD
jgi:hypothetical protein